MTPRYLTPTDAGIMVGILIMGFGLILAAAVKFFANKSREEYRLDAEVMEEACFLEAIENERRLYLPAAEAEVELFLDPSWKPAKASEQPSFVEERPFGQAVIDYRRMRREEVIKARAEEYRRNDGADLEAHDPARENYAAANAVERSDEDNLAFMEQQANDLDVRRRAQAAPTNKWNIDAWAAAQLYQSKSPHSRPVYCIWSRTNCPMSYACQLRHFW